MKSPKIIHHQNGRKTDDRVFLLTQVAKTMHLTRTEAAILRELASEGEGFSPSAAFLSQKTNCSRREVFVARAKLVEFGLLGETDRIIIVDWERLRLFSTLDPTLTSRSCTVAPVTLKKKISQSQRIAAYPEDYDSFEGFLKRSPFDDVVQFFGKLSADECQTVRKFIQDRKDYFDSPGQSNC